MVNTEAVFSNLWRKSELSTGILDQTADLTSKTHPGHQNTSYNF